MMNGEECEDQVADCLSFSFYPFCLFLLTSVGFVFGSVLFIFSSEGFSVLYYCPLGELFFYQ